MGTGVGGALAAGIALVVMSLNPMIKDDSTGSVPMLTLALNQPQDVSVAIDSEQELLGAQIRVVLTGGIELTGFEGRSDISWRTDLDQGVNRLTLPLIAVGPGSGQVLVEVEHGSKRQTFVVDIDVAGGNESAPAIPTAAHALGGGLVARGTVSHRPNFVNYREPNQRSDV